MVKLSTDAAGLLKKLPSNLHDGVRKGFTTASNDDKKRSRRKVQLN